MATVDDSQATITGDSRTRKPRSVPRRWRWTNEQFTKLADAGFFQQRRVELINGEIIELVVNPPHDTAVYLALHVFLRVFGAGYVVRPQMSFDLGRRYQPIPDLAVVIGDSRDYATRHPSSALLILEVSDSSLHQDRLVKSHRYAWAGIPDYWNVNLVGRQIEVYRNPGPDPDRPGRYRYFDVTIVTANGQIAPLAKPDQFIKVADLLP